eukprot:SAG31_NODE_5459_length_2524_cov_2.828041_1_plen_109_part_00
MQQQVFVRSAAQLKTHSLAFARNATVGQLKQRLADIDGVPTALQRITDGRRDLADDQPLPGGGDGAVPAATLHCLLRLRGGKGGFGAMLRSARGGLVRADTLLGASLG